MHTTTTYRSHWIDTAGRCYAQRRPFTTSQLSPVLNLDEVRAWLEISTSDQMLRRGFPGHDDDARIWYTRQFLAADAHPSEVERLAPLICEELTDDVPLYHQRHGMVSEDWRTPFVEMRERWPLPTLGGDCEIRNLTPHDVRSGEVWIGPSGVIARATEDSTPADPLIHSIPDPNGGPTDRLHIRIPTCTTTYTGLVGLPHPEPGVFLIVSMIVPGVARAMHRWLGDLLVPGDQVRDSAGRIVGCRSLQRVMP